MRHGAATTICKRGKGSMVRSRAGRRGRRAGGGMEGATGREEKVTARQRDTQTEVWSESSKKSLRRWAGRQVRRGA